MPPRGIGRLRATGQPVALFFFADRPIIRSGAGLPGALDVAALSDAQKQVRRAIHLAIRQASQDVGQHHKFNTAIAQVMTLMNVLEKAATATEQDRALLQEGLETVALLLAPLVVVSVTLAAVTLMVAALATASSSKDVISSLTISPQAPVSVPVTGLARPSKVVKLIVISQFLYAASVISSQFGVWASFTAVQLSDWPSSMAAQFGV